MAASQNDWPFLESRRGDAAVSRPPFYYIYGVPAREVDGQFVHVERVLDRGSLHGGHVEPHSHPHLNQVSLWRNARGAYLLEGETLELAADALTLIPAGVVHGFEIEPPSDATVISVSTGFAFALLAGGAESMWTLWRRPALVPLAPEVAGRFAALFAAVEEEYRFSTAQTEEAIACYLRLILIYAARLLERQAAPALASPQQALLSAFLALVEQNLRGRWSIAQYVDALGTTHYLLNSASQAALGRSPSQVVRDRLIDEAKRLLIFSKVTATEVGFALGFDDPAHFGRFFQAQTGRAPAAWRQEQIARRVRAEAERSSGTGARGR